MFWYQFHAMYLTNILLKKVKSKHVLVLLKSAVSDHKVSYVRERTGDKVEIVRFDPFIQQDSVYREEKKIKSMSSKFKPKGMESFRPISRFQIQ